MDTRVLVTYATKHGATGEIAEKIGEVLREAGLPTDVAPTYQVGDVTPTPRWCWAARSTLAAGANRRSSSCRTTRTR